MDKQVAGQPSFKKRFQIPWMKVIKWVLVIALVLGIGIPLIKWFLAMPDSWHSLLKDINANLLRDDRWLSILRGLRSTVIITILSIVLGTVLGMIFCTFRLSKDKFLRALGTIYVTVIRGTPTLIQLLLIYFAILGPTGMSKVVIAIIAFGLNSGAYMTEIMRGGVLSVSQGQIEAGRTLGLSQTKTMLFIVLPQAFKNMLPTYTSEIIVLLKETAIIGYIGFEDLTKVVDQIRANTYSAFFPYIIAGILYLLMTTILTKIFSVMEERMRRSDYR